MANSPTTLRGRRSPKLGHLYSSQSSGRNYRLSIIRPRDAKDALEFLTKHLLLEERLSKALDAALLSLTLENGKFMRDMSSLLGLLLNDGLSWMARDVATGQVAGVLVSFLHNKELSRHIEQLRMTSEKSCLYLKFVTDALGAADIEGNVGVTSFVDSFPLSVSPKWRREGLGTELFRRSMDHLRNEEYKHLVVLSSCPYTKRIMEGLGLASISELDFDRLEDFEGKSLLRRKEAVGQDNPLFGHKDESVISVYAKILQRRVPSIH